MLGQIKSYIDELLSQRVKILAVLFGFFFLIVILRLFNLQLIHGEDYQNNYNLKLEKTETITPTRGNIYDRNGKLLAYNELVYTITLDDQSNLKGEKLNALIYKLIHGIESRGDAINNTFPISLSYTGAYEFNVSGSTLNRFRADIFGHNNPADLAYNEKLGLDESSATADQIIDYLINKKYNINPEYTEKLRYEIAVIRYAMAQNSYKKYISTTIAEDVSQRTVAFVKENINELPGVAVVEQSMRRYNDSEYVAHIIGYTGKISTEEFAAATETDPTVEPNDVVGKAGIEKNMNEVLSGKKGKETLFVDNVGTILARGEKEDAKSGYDVYLAIDVDLQKAVYKLLEQELAGIIYSKITNSKVENSSKSADVLIPIYSVYYSLINNSIIDTAQFYENEATDTELAVARKFEAKQNSALSTIREYLGVNNTIVYKDLPDEYQNYATYIVQMIKRKGVFNADAIDSKDAKQIAWQNQELSVNEYLTYAIEQNWIDVSTYDSGNKYASSSELYGDLLDYIVEKLKADTGFGKLLYKNLILNDEITGRELCMILFEQDIIRFDENQYDGLANGTTSPYDFIRSKIKSLELTPGQLALDPCSASTVVVDPNTGELLALVSYPGYDNNRLANTMDAAYWSYLINCASNPLYNNATQERTAPGSTFKIVSATAGLAENAITTSSIIDAKGLFDKVSNKPRCWSYPSSHGPIGVQEAITVSCNYFFYEVGYRLAGGETNYVDANGIDKIRLYASYFGLDEKTGIEIEENTPHIATEYPVMAAIGQSDNDFTTISLARYAAAVANNGTVYNLTLLDSVKDRDQNVIEKFSPTIRNSIDCLSKGQWDTIHEGMRGVVTSSSVFKDFDLALAGKTGTAQQVQTRPNHALFISYAPYDNPKVAMATRITYGYTSRNAAEVSRNIYSYIFAVDSAEGLLNGQATNVTTTNAVTD